jgi:putative transposase
MRVGLFVPCYIDAFFPRSASPASSSSSASATRSCARATPCLHLRRSFRQARWQTAPVIRQPLRRPDFLNEAAAGAAAVEVCRHYGISETTFYRWKADFSGVAVNDTKRLRQIEAENSRQKRLLAQAHLVLTSDKGQLDFEQDPLETVSLRCMSGMAGRPWRRARL